MTGVDQCKICSLGTLLLFEKKLNIGGSVDDMYICSRCYVITNFSKQGQNLELQERALKEFYKYSQEEIAAIPSTVESLRNMIKDSFVPLLPYVEGKIFLDIGSGRGFMIIAASEVGFKKVYGVDLDSVVFEETKRHYKTRENVFLVRNIKEIEKKVDCVTMWHVLEHIFAPNDFFDNLRPLLNINCLLFIQTPQYYQPYICDTHHYFYNEPSIRTLLVNNGFEPIRVNYDVVNQFMTVVAKYIG